MLIENILEKTLVTGAHEQRTLTEKQNTVCFSFPRFTCAINDRFFMYEGLAVSRVVVI